MKNQYRVAAALTLSVAAIADAVTISNLNGQSCPAGTIGAWHFVNNQIPVGTGAGTLSASFSSGDVCQTSPSQINNTNQHFDCIASGTLTGASTNLPGRLVLSHFTCTTTEPPPPPPPCTDPKVCPPPPPPPK